MQDDLTYSVWLVNRLVDPTIDNNCRITLAAHQGHEAVVKHLLAEPHVDFLDYNMAMCYAAQFGHAPVLKLLLEDGRADPTVDDNTPMKIAVMHGFVSVLDALLMDGRADPTADDNLLIRSAVRRGKQSDVVKALMRDHRVRKGVFQDKVLYAHIGSGWVRMDVLRCMERGRTSTPEEDSRAGAIARLLTDRRMWGKGQSIRQHVVWLLG